MDAHKFAIAREALIKCGWTQRVLKHPSGAMCVRGSLNFACTGSATFPDGEAWELEMFLKKVNGLLGGVPFHNDRFTTSIEDVLGWLQYAEEAAFAQAKVDAAHDHDLKG